MRCDLAWFNQQMIAATVPRKIRRSVTAVVCGQHTGSGMGSHAELHQAVGSEERRLRVPSQSSTGQSRPARARAETTRARGCGQEAGTTSRNRRSDNPRQGPRHARRVGHSNRQDPRALLRRLRTHPRCSGSQHVLAGQPQQGEARPRNPQLHPRDEPHPRGNQPGPHRIPLLCRGPSRSLPRSTESSRTVATPTRERTSSARFTSSGINVVMDYTKTMVNQPQATTLGKRREPVIIHCGTILSNGIPHNKKTAPDRLRPRRQGARTPAVVRRASPTVPLVLPKAPPPGAADGSRARSAPAASRQRTGPRPSPTTCRWWPAPQPQQAAT